MSKLLIIGSGISGLSCAYYAAKKGIKVSIVTDDLPERSQSVMAAGGINCFDKRQESDASMHIEETLKSACDIANVEAIKGLCEDAENILLDLKNMGVLFHIDEDGNLSRRAFGGQSKNRTAYSGTSTGKQIVTALVRALRTFEKQGLVEFSFRTHFIAPIIKDNKMLGAIVYKENSNKSEPLYADYFVLATGGLNGLYGKTTGSKYNNGYAAASLFENGLAMANLEFVQFHPTTIRAFGKNMLISEAARGEGGRLFYLDENKNRIYFLEDKYGEKGNLQTRDIVSREMFAAPSQVYLDISFLGSKVIHEKLEEVDTLCKTYLGLDPSKEAIPVEPAVHFFMGGVLVDNLHKTNIERLYAIGECASAYHGANRLGGNSLLAAIHSARVVANNLVNDDACKEIEFGDNAVLFAEEKYLHFKNNQNALDKLFDIMISNVGIVRNEDMLNCALNEIENLDSQFGFGILKVAKATVLLAKERRESRGSHYREDYKETNPKFAKPSYALIKNGEIVVGVGENGIQN